ncbi:hypothetical protein GOBAR_AA00252 [Gossypium barbadense]|uniref:Uncharacterized protein n=1 Tax=Gossypium barbadense TaxID=3634 RepID=A0A2P5YXI9_GOSBA|nr:hypothetical protein GOBAR_AA00252 [Gossypium barbadense]
MSNRNQKYMMNQSDTMMSVGMKQNEKDPRIATSKLNTNGVIPFTALNAFPYGTVEPPQHPFTSPFGHRFFPLARTTLTKTPFLSSLTVHTPHKTSKLDPTSFPHPHTTHLPTRPPVAPLLIVATSSRILLFLLCLVVKYLVLFDFFYFHEYHDKHTRQENFYSCFEKRKGPGATSLSASTEVRHPLLRFLSGLQDDLFQLLHMRPLGVGRCIDWVALDQHVINTHDEADTITFQFGGLVRHMSIPEFGIAWGIYTDEFIGADNFLRLHRHIHHSPSYCWTDLTASQICYDVICSKATSLSLALRYIHALLAHMLTGRRESTGVINTIDAYYLWSMVTGHIFDLAYFIALAFRHQTDCHRRGPICLGPYGISSMIHMRVIKRHRGFDPPQYKLIHSDVDDVPPPHEDPHPPPPPSSHRPPTATLINISERLTHFEQ